jgi:O-antigen biosynthesis protein
MLPTEISPQKPRSRLGKFNPLNGLRALNRSIRRTLTQRYNILVCAPPWSRGSGGIRAINLLAYQLDRLGYNSFVVDADTVAAAPFPLRLADIARSRESKRLVLAVYPEVCEGNPLEVDAVVRFLLNKPGVVNPGAELTYAKDDVFVAFDPSHAPAGTSAYDLFVPTVDRTVYYPPKVPSRRSGFVIFSNRSDTLLELPTWVSPISVVSRQKPLGHEELGNLYRSSRAVVVRERSTAIYEAIMCGCPVICLESENFTEATYQRRFGGAGQVWGWHEDLLEKATADTAAFRTIYNALERNFAARVNLVFSSIIERFRQRLEK